MLNPTDEQEKILEAFTKNPDKDLVINAYAGTGKTTTLKMIAEENPRTKFLYLAFNKKIVEEAKKKFPRNVTVKTAHDLAYRGMELFNHPDKLERKKFPYETLLTRLPREVIEIDGLDQKAATDVIRDLVRYYEFSDKRSFDYSYTEYKFKHILQACLLAQNIDLAKLKEKQETIMAYTKAKGQELDEETLEAFIQMLEKVKSGDRRYKVVSSMKKVDRGLLVAVLDVMDFPHEKYEDTVEEFLGYIHSELSHFWDSFSDLDNEIPFEHSTYLKLYHLSEPVIRGYDCILFDEAQDANPVILDIVKQQTHCRKVWVGDKHQAIYQFTGAINTIEQIMDDPSCCLLYLTKSFRFGSNISNVANRILNEKRKQGDKIKGKEDPNLIGLRPLEKKVSVDSITILCRTNAGVIEEAISLLEEDEESIYIGDSISDSVLNDMEDVYHLFCNNKKKIKSYYIRSFYSLDELLKESYLKMDSDLNRVIKIVQTYSKGPFLQLVAKLRKVSKFNPLVDNPKYQIITAHKAKGLEWGAVKLSNDFDKVFLGEGGTELKKNIAEGEFNLLYVAATRAERLAIFPPKLSEYLQVL